MEGAIIKFDIIKFHHEGTKTQRHKTRILVSG
jgi:hypothetical protein